MDTSRSHVELLRELIPKVRIGLCVLFEYGLEDLELCTSCPFSVFDLVGGVWVECAEVDGGVGLYERAGVGRVLEAHQGGGEDKVVVGRRRGGHVLNEKENSQTKPCRQEQTREPFNH